jgi:hypothetical protein
MRITRYTLTTLKRIAAIRSPILRIDLPGFDPIFYLYWYRDVENYKAGPLRHFLEVGWKEGRDPSGGFSTEAYLDANPDVREKNINPLLHFLEHGLAEGRSGWQKNPTVPPPRPQAPGYNDRKLLAAPSRAEPIVSQPKT